MSDVSTPDPPQAALWPSTPTATESEHVEIRIYIVSGKHGFLTVPEDFCRECHLFVRAADIAADRADVPVDVNVVSWWTRFLGALRYGGYHPPVMIVGGRKLAQGYDVPTPDDVLEAINAAAAR